MSERISTILQTRDSAAVIHISKNIDGIIIGAFAYHVNNQEHVDKWQ